MAKFKTDCIKGEVRVQNNLSSNERLYNAHLPHKVLNLHVKSNSRNKAIKVRKFAYIAAAMFTSLRTCDHAAVLPRDVIALYPQYQRHD